MPRPRKPATPFRYFNSSPEVIRLVVMMYVRFRRMKTLQKFASVHANVHNHFSLERHLVDRQTYKDRRSAALVEWQVLAS